MNKTLFVAAVMSSVIAFAPAALAHGCYRHHSYHHYKHQACKGDVGAYGSSKSMQKQPGAGGQDSRDQKPGANPSDQGGDRSPSGSPRQGI